MTIRQYAQECSQLFTSPESLGLNSKPLIAEFETQRSRFKVWAGNLGVFAKGRASADFRLHNDPTARGILINLLTRLANKLKSPSGTIQAKTNQLTPKSNLEGSDSDSSVASLVIEVETDSGSDSDQPGNEQSARHEALDDIKQTISRLYRFTAVVRRPGAKNERERVLRYVQNQDPPIDLSELKSHIEWQLGRHGPRLVPRSPLSNRLVEAALYRRQKFLYCQSHQAKLQRGTDEFFESSQQHQPAVRVPEETANPGVTTNETVSRLKHGDLAPTLIETEATIPDKASASTYARSRVISGTMASAIGRQGELDIPPPPKPLGDGTETQCPYCMHIIDDELRGKNAELQWRRHVMKDLEPYVCLFDDCYMTSTCFKTTEEWIDHMRWDHTTRYSCQVAGHEDMFFETATELEQHLVGEHQQVIPEYELHALAKKGIRPSPDVFAFLSSYLNHGQSRASGDILLCPMCDLSLSEVDDLGEVDIGNLSVMRFSDEVYKEIREHIASHMEKIALFSLPERKDVEAESSAKQVSDLTSERWNDDTFDTGALSFDDPLVDISDNVENIPPPPGSWSDILGDWIFGGNSDYDPGNDHLICRIKVLKGLVPRTATEYYEYFSDFAEKNLGSFGFDVKVKKQLAHRAAEVAEELKFEYQLKDDEVPKVAKLALFDIFVLCDNSGSMRLGDRIQTLNQTVQSIAHWATRINNNGISLKFLNGGWDGDGSYDGLTDLSRIDELINGEPVGEYRNCLRDIIFEAKIGHRLPKMATVFIVSRVGDDSKALEFIEGLSADEKISDLMLGSTSRLEETIEGLAEEGEHAYRRYLMRMFIDAVDGQAV
ncbi:hypothetical protein FQN54_001869 [Arachnomyces sp. PD_36]|nr:hypothetical protein FQN54_001869 [Arachnomyces sp. PD_36]